MNIRLLYDATTPRCSDLRGCTTLLQSVQPWVTVPSPAWLDSIVVSMTRYLHRAAAESPRQHRCQHDSATLSLAWLGIYIVPRPSCPDNAVVSMTRHLHRVVAKSPRQRHRQHDSAALSLSWLNINIAPWPSRPGSIVNQHDSTTLSQTWLGSYIAPQPCRPGSVVTSMTWV
jgi:hypothetical protein